jgi:type II secretory pathway pseudopilin PulG
MHLNPKHLESLRPILLGCNCVPMKKRGFILVVTLSMVILLTIIAVGLLSLSAVSLRAVSEQSAAAAARANARLALMLAIGELQRELGPDQRVNATASILSADGEKKPSAAPGRRHWVGVYDAWNSTSGANRPSPNLRKWLVSGPDLLTSDPLAPNAAAASQDLILWKGNKPDGSDQVAVPRMSVEAAAPDGHAGSYAWWVGDENSKAMVSRLPTDSGNPALTRADSQAAPATAFHHSIALTGIARSSEGLDRLVSHGTLDLMGVGADAAQKSLHDFTDRSSGVLTDVARGGLKRDLSLYLDHPVSEPLAPMLPNNRRLYPDGITWEELWLYHNVWRALEPPDPRLASMTGGDIADSLVLMTKPGLGVESVSALQSDPYAIYKLPAFLRMQWLVSLWATPKPDTSPVEYNLFWVTDGILTFWNPSDVPITLHPDSYITYKLWNLPYNLELSDDDGRLALRSFRRAARGSDQTYQIQAMLMGTAPDPYWKRRGEADPVVLMPGEVLLMSENAAPANPAPYNLGANGREPGVGLKAGWNLGVGTRVAVGSTSRPITANTNLRFRVSPNSDYAGNSTDRLSLCNFSMWYGADSRGQNLPPNALSQPLGGRHIRSPVPGLPGRTANQHPEIFPTVEGDLPSVTTMTGKGKHPFFLFSHQTKSEDSSTAWSRMYNTRNSSAFPHNLEPLTVAISGHEVVVDGLSGAQDSRMTQLSRNQLNRGLFGGSYWDHGRGVDTVIVQSIPREPPLSLGAFQHAIANGTTNRMSGGALNPNMGNRNPDISHAISNSYALPTIGPEEISSPNFTDHSYHVNRMLWDSWFLSSIVQRQAPHHTEKKTDREVYQDFLADPIAYPLPNRRMKPTPVAVAAGVNALFDDSLDAHEIASSNLMVEGAFNVNSTSVEAWKALLGSMDDAFIPVAYGTNSPATAAPHRAMEIPVHSLLTSFGSGEDRSGAAFEGAELASARNPAQWRGYRKLNRAEIKELAGKLVEEIRARGPFLSMADFINRRPNGGETDYALRGALQAALDLTVNKTLFDAVGRVGTAPAGLYVFPDAAELPKSLISPAHVRQADILTSIGSQLTARSDTFRIRAYGESLDRNGKVLARAWCEAVVQRLPDYIDPVDPPYAADPPAPDPEPRMVPELTSAANKNMGRRIEIVSFRWLAPDESQ